MICVILANIRKGLKMPYNLLLVNEHFEVEQNAEITLLDHSCTPLKSYKKWDFKAGEDRESGVYYR